MKLISERGKKLGSIMKATHELWDLEAFGREVKRRKILERLYKKLYRCENNSAADLSLSPKEILDFIYSRAADGYPYRWREP